MSCNPFFFVQVLLCCGAPFLPMGSFARNWAFGINSKSFLLELWLWLCAASLSMGRGTGEILIQQQPQVPCTLGGRDPSQTRVGCFQVEIFLCVLSHLPRDQKHERSITELSEVGLASHPFQMCTRQQLSGVWTPWLPGHPTPGCCLGGNKYH